MSSVQTIIDSARAGTDQDTAGQITDAQLIAWVNEDVQLMYRQLTEYVPEAFVKVSATFPLTNSINYQDVTASPLSLTDFGKIYRLEMLVGSIYRPLEQADPLDPERCSSSAFTLRVNTVTVYPSQNAAGTYRLSYLPSPPALTLAATAISMPSGFERPLAERVCARIRSRFEEDPSFHLQAADAAWREYRRYLRRQYGAHPTSGLRQVRAW